MKIGKDFVELTSIHREPAGVNRDMILSKLVINEDGTVTGEVVDAERIERKPGADGLFPWRLTTRITDPKIVKAFQRLAPASSIRGNAKSTKVAKPKPAKKAATKKAKPRRKK